MMKGRRLLLYFLGLFGLLALAGSAQAALQAQETSLAATGTAYELNLDSQGVLWVSDANAGEIRAVNAASGAYTIYPVGGAPSDARSDGAGTVWWADFGSNKLNHLTTGSNQVTTWEIPGSTGLYSTGIDSGGDVWVSDYYASLLYQLDPAGNELCSYAIPNFGVSEYLSMDGSRITFGDYVNGRIVRLEGTTFTWWILPPGSYPRDLAVDGNGRVWWTDLNKGYVGRLDPVASTIITFTPPISGTPQLLTLSGGKVWYTQQDPGRLVKFDPAVASGITATVISGAKAASPSCSTLLPQAPVDVTPVSGQASWTGQEYQTVLDQSGWQIYAMPAGSVPWGVAATDKIWLVDQGRKVLAKVSPSSLIYLPMVIRP
jgi:streptogramin lyase